MLEYGPRVGSIAPLSLLRRFLRHSGSTTAFLEELLGEELRVVVLFHKEADQSLERESVLAGSRSGPLVASHCVLDLAAWSDEERDLLRAGKTPIGRILKMQTAAGPIKDQISVVGGRHHRLAGLLSVADFDRAFLKKYRLQREGQCLGRVVEAASEASLERALLR